MAADKGDEGAMRNYAVMLEKGDGVPENKSETDHYFEMALYIRIARFILKIADKWDADAMFEYALMLEQGDIVKSNMKEAVLYLKNAADKGNRNAMNKYRDMLYDWSSSIFQDGCW